MITLHKALRIYGRVLWPSGEAADGVRITAFSGERRLMSSQSGQNGRFFVLAPLDPQAPVRIEVEVPKDAPKNPGYRGSVEDVTSDTELVEIVLEPPHG